MPICVCGHEYADHWKALLVPYVGLIRLGCLLAVFLKLNVIPHLCLISIVWCFDMNHYLRHYFYMTSVALMALAVSLSVTLGKQTNRKETRLVCQSWQFL